MEVQKKELAGGRRELKKSARKIEIQDTIIKKIRNQSLQKDAQIKEMRKLLKEDVDNTVTFFLPSVLWTYNEFDSSNIKWI